MGRFFDSSDYYYRSSHRRLQMDDAYLRRFQPEQRMYAAVLMRALTDAGIIHMRGSPCASIEPAIRRGARKWLENWKDRRTLSFYYVCVICELDPREMAVWTLLKLDNLKMAA